MILALGTTCVRKFWICGVIIRTNFFIYLDFHITCEVYTDLKTNLISSPEPISGEKSE
jgi:hypothetical protein